MANKFRGIEPLQPGEDSTRPVQMGMDGGYRGDVSPRSVPPNSTPEISEIRFERTAIRRDFGWVAIGTAAASRILGLIEHKYIDDNLTFHRIVRVIRAATLAQLEVWDGANWILTDTSVETIVDEYLSMVSAQGCLYMAEGSQILEWCEVLLQIPQEDDFPNGNLLTEAGAATTAIVIPGDAGPLDYVINYDVTVVSSPTQDTTIVVEFFHGGISLGTELFFVGQFETFPFSFPNQTFAFTRQITSGQSLSIQVQSAEGGGTTFELDNVITVGPGPPDFIGDKTPQTQPAFDDNYRYFFNMSAVGGGTTVGFYVENGSGWLQVGTALIVADGADDRIFNVPGLIDPAAMFGFAIEAGPGGIGDTQVGWTRSNADFTVHGHNNATQGDTPAGVTYNTTGAVVSQFEALDPAPAARYLAHFARRLIALWNFGDTQVLSWSRDGILNDFVGVGSGQSILVETHSDAVDNLQGAVALGDNFLAIFRARSIWRAFETGSEALAIGAVSWIENLGTNYPFSIRKVRGGAIFLGHDNMVYFLTENGEQAIGKPIHQDLIASLTGDLSLVDSGYDPTFGEYYLGIPEAAATNITLAWIFDVDRFIDNQEIVWRKRPMAIQRFAAFGVSEVE